MSMTTMRNKLHGHDGFSLIEILVVILILGILMGIAVPSFLGAKRNGQDSKAQSALRSGLSAERTHYIDYQAYTANSTDLRKIESNLDWSTTDANANGVLPALLASGQAVVLVSTSQSGSQFCIMNIAQDLTSGNANGETTAGTYYAKLEGSATPSSTATGAECGTSAGTYSRSDAPW